MSHGVIGSTEASEAFSLGSSPGGTAQKIIWIGQPNDGGGTCLENRLLERAYEFEPRPIRKIIASQSFPKSTGCWSEAKDDWGQIVYNGC